MKKHPTPTLYLFALIPILFLLSISIFHIRHLIHAFHQTPISNTLSIIPEKDRKTLTTFFKNLLIDERFSYTLFGDKPLSMSCCIPTTQNTTNPLLAQWQLWQKYQHLFPSTHFALRTITSPSNDKTCILLINKKQFQKAVKKHARLFRVMAGHPIQEDDLLNTFLTATHPIRKGLKNHSMLIGILFGYGKNNAALYNRKQLIEKALLSCNPKAIAPSRHYNTLQEELQDLTHILRPFACANNVPYPCERFLVDPSSKETQQLIKKYQKTGKEIQPLLTEDHFLERILTHYTSP